KHFVMAVATGNVPRFQQLVRQGLNERVSVSQLVSRLSETVAGLYQCRSYDQSDLDVLLLVLRLGGQKLLYAMSQHIALPSIRALRHRGKFMRLMPSLGVPTSEEIKFNLSELFGHQPTPRTPENHGLDVFWDEINEEDVACYFPHLDSVGGLCREHSCHVNTRLTTLDNTINMAKSLDNGTVHYGKEASVIALSSFSATLRGAFPVIASPTCKRETPEESGRLLQTVLTAWKQTYAAHLGPIWSFASDGDARRRAMVYHEFMRKKIEPSHQLYKYLGQMPGLNLEVGEDNVTGDFDWKHEIKRKCLLYIRGGRLLRTADGFQIGRIIINSTILAQHFFSDDEVNRLMNPANAQDVPRAIKLLRAVSAITAEPSDGPIVNQEASHISVYGEMFAAFMEPFIQPTWSLTEQVESLSKHAHMSFSLFHLHCINAMPYQLYGDIQVTIKNVMFCTAKQQELNGSHPFYLFWTGDDRLENLFGRVCMQGGHNPNFSFKQLLNRLGAAVDISHVYEQLPWLDAGHRRLKVTRTEHADHLNPESWTGNVIADSVNLQTAWANGQQAATRALARVDIIPDYDNLFDPGWVRDLLKPFGDGKYPGVSTEPDRSL
ncbi:hypothetical protein B0H21DRAFT_681162, partial [Amylocystis lapponica]